MVLDMQMQMQHLPRRLTDDAVISEFNKDAKNGAFDQPSFAPKGTDKTLGHSMSDFHQPSICILMPSLLFARKHVNKCCRCRCCGRRGCRGRGLMLMWRHDALSRTSCSQCRNAK
jgi:hypothetical protein